MKRTVLIWCVLTVLICTLFSSLAIQETFSAIKRTSCAELKSHRTRVANSKNPIIKRLITRYDSEIRSRCNNSSKCTQLNKIKNRYTDLKSNTKLNKKTKQRIIERERFFDNLLTNYDCTKNRNVKLSPVKPIVKVNKSVKKPESFSDWFDDKITKEVIPPKNKYDKNRCNNASKRFNFLIYKTPEKKNSVDAQRWKKENVDKYCIKGEQARFHKLNTEGSSYLQLEEGSSKKEENIQKCYEKCKDNEDCYGFSYFDKGSFKGRGTNCITYKKKDGAISTMKELSGANIRNYLKVEEGKTVPTVKKTEAVDISSSDALQVGGMYNYCYLSSDKGGWTPSKERMEYIGFKKTGGENLPTFRSAQGVRYFHTGDPKMNSPMPIKYGQLFKGDRALRGRTPYGHHSSHTRMYVINPEHCNNKAVNSASEPKDGVWNKPLDEVIRPGRKVYMCFETNTRVNYSNQVYKYLGIENGKAVFEKITGNDRGKHEYEIPASGKITYDTMYKHIGSNKYHYFTDLPESRCANGRQSYWGPPMPKSPTFVRMTLINNKKTYNLTSNPDNRLKTIGIPYGISEMNKLNANIMGQKPIEIEINKGYVKSNPFIPLSSTAESLWPYNIVVNRGSEKGFDTLFVTVQYCEGDKCTNKEKHFKIANQSRFGYVHVRDNGYRFFLISSHGTMIKLTTLRKIGNSIRWHGSVYCRTTNYANAVTAHNKEKQGKNANQLKSINNKYANLYKAARERDASVCLKSLKNFSEHVYPLVYVQFESTAQVRKP
ncbi:hypothetical protein TetV_349 [Tetraselmis virus 1]|uniref:Apple domain-containing protein n=1 Tax=Tetraselmis virus 1 TaxID=2060617 RepID=A0A2P0VNF9_9VIRU|nr:hypothetical protein QJ968_gp349 [Tetraselmis virus 1]AUF82441.1 hypothetical protein TetV_349 [Tetraselmis virus 1]